MPLLPLLLQSTSFSNPFLSTLVPSIGLAYTLQGLAAIPSILGQTEKYYDLSGSLTYLSCVGLSLALPAVRARGAARAVGGIGTWGGWNWRQVVLSAAVGVWASRLGTYLFRRISSDGGTDSRFTEIRRSPPKFLFAFFLQATWVSLCLMPVLALNAIPAARFAALPSSVALTDILGLTLYAGGLSLEIAADRQKAAWTREKRAKKHDEDFLTRGLWSRSRHPNYFGEMMLWTGIAVVAAGVLVRNVGQVGMGLRLSPGTAGAGGMIRGRALGMLMAGVSPAFITILLLFVSGVPLSENKYDAKYGDREDYREWKRNTPMLVPKLFSGKGKES